jgi:hypothetical protein
MPPPVTHELLKGRIRRVTVFRVRVRVRVGVRLRDGWG